MMPSPPHLTFAKLMVFMLNSLPQRCTAYVLGEQALPEKPPIFTIASAVGLKLSIVMSQSALEAIQQEIHPLEQGHVLYKSTLNTYTITLDKLNSGELSLAEDPEDSDDDDEADENVTDPAWRRRKNDCDRRPDPN